MNDDFKGMTLGRFTGFHDSVGEKIHVGDLVKLPCYNWEAHGTFALWRVIERNGLPFLIYERSEKGHVWPVGHKAKSLIGLYPTNSEIMARTDDWSQIKLDFEEIHVVKGSG